MRYAILVTLSLVLSVGDANAKKVKPAPAGPTVIYMINRSPDVAPQPWGGHWNQDVFNACVALLRPHVNLVATFYHPQGVDLVIADPASNPHPRGWKATFKSGNEGGSHSVSNGFPVAVAYTDSLVHVHSPCTIMGEELAEMLGNPRPGSVCITVPGGKRIEPELSDPIWGSGYCPQGYESECQDTVAGPLPGFVLPAWFANKHGHSGISNEMTVPAGVVTNAWERTSGGAYYPCN